MRIAEIRKLERNVIPAPPIDPGTVCWVTTPDGRPYLATYRGYVQTSATTCNAVVECLPCSAPYSVN